MSCGGLTWIWIGCFVLVVESLVGAVLIEMDVDPKNFPFSDAWRWLCRLSISEIRWSGTFEVRQAMYLGRSAAGIGSNLLAVAGCQVSDRT